MEKQKMVLFSLCSAILIMVSTVINPASTLFDSSTPTDINGNTPTLCPTSTCNPNTPTSVDGTPDFGTPTSTPLFDSTPPEILEFDVQPRFTNGPVTISWNVIDEMGSRLNRVEIFRAQGNPGAWSLIGTVYFPYDNYGLWYDTFVDNPPEGIWWYQISVIDNAGNRAWSSPIIVTIGMASVTLTPTTCPTCNPFTPTRSNGNTSTSTLTPTATLVPTAISNPTPTAVIEPTFTSLATSIPTPPTQVIEPTFTATATSIPTSTLTPTPPVPTATLTPTNTPWPTPTRTNTSTAIFTPTPTPTFTPLPVPTPADSIVPVVAQFDVQPRITNGPVTISWTAYDSGGSYLNRAEVWRAPDISGVPGAWTQIDGNYYAPYRFDGPWSGATTDSPLEGKWWYSLRILDNAGNTGYASDPLCGSSSSISLASVQTFQSLGFCSIGTIVDKSSPAIISFTVDPYQQMSSAYLTFRWQAMDTAGAGLGQAEIWRTSDSPTATNRNWEQVAVKQAPLFTTWWEDSIQILSKGGLWWYGIHVTDKAGNWNTEPNPPGSIFIVVPFLESPVQGSSSAVALSGNRYYLNCGDVGRINSWFDHFYPNGSENMKVLLWNGVHYNLPVIDENGRIENDYEGEGRWWYDGHGGIDFCKMIQGEKVYSAANGKVFKIGEELFGSRYVVIYHENNFFTYYGHLASRDVYVGQTVFSGQPIGTMGMTGADGIHLHFNVFYDENNDGTYSWRVEEVDPFGWKPNMRGVIDSEPDPWEPGGTWEKGGSGFRSYYLWKEMSPIFSTQMGVSGGEVVNPSGRTRAIIPSESLTGTVTFELQEMPPSPELLAANQIVLGVPFRIGVPEWESQDSLLVLSAESEFSKPIAVSVDYDERTMVHFNVAELKMLRWNESSGITALPVIVETVDENIRRAIAETSEVGSFVLQAPLLCPEDKEPNDSYQTAIRLDANGTFIKNLFDTEEDEDWFYFNATKDYAYATEFKDFTGGASLTTEIYGYDGITRLNSSDVNYFEWHALGDGIYFVRIIRTDVAFGCNTGYSIGITGERKNVYLPFLVR